MQVSKYAPHLEEMRSSIFALCSKFDDAYWLGCDDRAEYPIEFVKEVAAAGWFGVIVPEEYGGSGLGVTEGAVAMQAFVESGAGYAGAGAVANVVFIPTVLTKFGTEEQKKKILPLIATGTALSVFGVTEPDAGLDTTSIKTKAVRQGDKYIVHGRKVWSSGAQRGDKLMLLARTAPKSEGAKPDDGMTLFYTDFDRRHLTAKRIKTMGRIAIDTNELFIDGLEIPVEDRIGEEGRGFRYILHGLNSERILLAAMAVGLGRLALRKAARYANERIVFGRPIGKNQGIQHPLAVNWMELEAANSLMLRAAQLYDAGEQCAAEANAAKYLAAEAAFKACSQAVLTHGGFGYSKEFHVERYLRESFVPRIAPVSREMIMCFIAERMLGLPKSY